MYLVWKFIIFGVGVFPLTDLGFYHILERDLGLIQRGGAQNYGAIISKFSILCVIPPLPSTLLGFFPFQWLPLALYLHFYIPEGQIVFGS